jgi:hypothetical protein
MPCHVYDRKCSGSDGAIPLCTPTAGDAGIMVEPLVRSPHADVRAAAVNALGCISLVAELQATITSSPGMVGQALDWMDWIADATIDHATSAVAAAVSVLNRLFERAERVPAHTAEGYLTQQMVERVAKRLGAGMGPMLQAWQQLPANVQVRSSSAHISVCWQQLQHGVQPSPAPMHGRRAGHQSPGSAAYAACTAGPPMPHSQASSGCGMRYSAAFPSSVQMQLVRSPPHAIISADAASSLRHTSRACSLPQLTSLSTTPLCSPAYGSTAAWPRTSSHLSSQLRPPASSCFPLLPPADPCRPLLSHTPATHRRPAATPSSGDCSAAPAPAGLLHHRQWLQAGGC